LRAHLVRDEAGERGSARALRSQDCDGRRLPPVQGRRLRAQEQVQGRSGLVESLQRRQKSFTRREDIQRLEWSHVMAVVRLERMVRETEIFPENTHESELVGKNSPNFLRRKSFRFCFATSHGGLQIRFNRAASAAERSL